MTTPGAGTQGSLHWLTFIPGRSSGPVPHLMHRIKSPTAPLRRCSRLVVVQNARLDWKFAEVVQNARLDFKFTEERIKKSTLYQMALLGVSRWRVGQVDWDMLAQQLQHNGFILYSIVVGVVGFQVCTAYGMGWSLLGACMLTTCLGYSIFIQQALLQQSKNQDAPHGPGVEDTLLRAQSLALRTMSFRAGQKSKGLNSPMMVLSSLFEPSPVYLMLNCWSIYAIGQCAICGVLGNGVLLLVSIASLLAGRWLQHSLWVLCRPPTSACQAKSQGGGPMEGTLQESATNMFEMLFTPVGTWGIGPVFNGAVWFAALLLPQVEYPASPVVMAPLWTALGAPVLLLAEDVYSLFNKRRRDEKYAMSMGPGLQVGSAIVGMGGALLMKNLGLILL